MSFYNCDWLVTKWNEDHLAMYNGTINYNLIIYYNIQLLIFKNQLERCTYNLPSTYFLKKYFSSSKYKSKCAGL